MKLLLNQKGSRQAWLHTFYLVPVKIETEVSRERTAILCTTMLFCVSAFNRVSKTMKVLNAIRMQCTNRNHKWNYVEKYQSYLNAGESCYVSFCGEMCQPGYFAEAQMKGQVG